MHVNNCNMHFECYSAEVENTKITLLQIYWKFAKISSESVKFYIRCNRNILVFLWFIVRKWRSTSIGKQEFISAFAEVCKVRVFSSPIITKAMLVDAIRN